MSRSEYRKMRTLQKQWDAIQAANALLEQSTDATSRKMDTLAMADIGLATLEWPNNPQSHAYKAIDFLQEWETVVANHILDGTNHMHKAIRAMIRKIKPIRLQNLVTVALETGRLRDGSPARR